MPLSLETTPTETLGGLDVKTVMSLDLLVNEYVLMAVDVEENGVSLFIPADYPEPVLWRVAAWPVSNEETAVVRFDGPERVYFEVEVGPQDFTRLILPGQDHETW